MKQIEVVCWRGGSGHRCIRALIAIHTEHPTHEPDACSRRPDAISQRLEANLQRPEANCHQPEASLHAPEANSLRPEAHLQRPEAYLQRPEANCHKPEAYLQNQEAHSHPPPKKHPEPTSDGGSRGQVPGLQPRDPSVRGLGAGLFLGPRKLQPAHLLKLRTFRAVGALHLLLHHQGRIHHIDHVQVKRRVPLRPGVGHRRVRVAHP